MTVFSRLRQRVTSVLFAYRQDVPANESTERVSLVEALSGFAGQWVAVDRATNQAVLVAETPYALSAKIRSEGRRNVAIVRAPDPEQPELVGLG